MATKSAAVEKFLANLGSTELLLKLDWDEWLTIEAPYSSVKMSSQDVVARYNRNGYDWDIHGTLFTPEEELLDRNLKCTFNVILQGAGLLTDQHFAGREIIGFGHSTGGPMAAHLTRFSKKTKVIGLVGFGSGGPDGWRLEWRNQTGAEKYT